ncbi:hypothetical protein ACFQHW_03420 [Lapidilactobacillus achengensis]|uniref:Uncharacterized protein n=1 Tax=Lapidilactobacillus achengensis TaxID=2486000 RepID=A0ABW1UKZ1_9LACO|nr:hypothetical protein [Lapidilactobacillus achengensis]
MAKRIGADFVVGLIVFTLWFVSGLVWFWLTNGTVVGKVLSSFGVAAVIGGITFVVELFIREK